MDLGLKGRVAIVAAASQGLGKATALGFVREGAHVVICGRDKKRIEAAGKELRQHCASKKQTVLPVVGDVSRLKDVKHVVKSAVEKFERLDILVTNAGGPPSGSFADLSDDKWETGFAQNLLSVIRFMREVLPVMRKQQWGRVINITSLTVKQPVNDLIVSSTLRPGIIGIAKVLANLHASEGITINNVAPGYIMTGRQEELGKMRAGKKGLSFDEYVRDVTKEVPAGRFGTPEELANVIVFLASERASYVTGTTLSVDGGLVKFLL